MAVALVGSVTHTQVGNTPSAASIPVTRNGIVAGNLIVVAVSVDNVVTISNVGDGTTTVTSADVAANSATLAQRIGLYSFPNHTGGNFTFTANFSGSSNFRQIEVIELSGADLVTPLQGTATATGTSAAPASGNVSPSPTLPGTYILGYAIGATALTSAGGYSDLVNDPTVITSDLEGLAQAVAAATGPSWTMTSGAWGAIGASYKPAVATGFMPFDLAHSQLHQTMVSQ